MGVGGSFQRLAEVREEKFACVTNAEARPHSGPDEGLSLLERVARVTPPRWDYSAAFVIVC